MSATSSPFHRPVIYCRNHLLSLRFSHSSRWSITSSLLFQPLPLSRASQQELSLPLSPVQKPFVLSQPLISLWDIFASPISKASKRHLRAFPLFVGNPTDTTWSS